MKDSNGQRSVKPRQARGAVRRAREVGLAVVLEGAVVVASVSKAEALRVLGRLKPGAMVPLENVFGTLVIG